MRPIILKPKPMEEKIVGISDSISYLTELIFQLSKYVTKRGLSKNGVYALELFFLTGGLLLTNTQMPTTLMGILKIYSFPLLFFLYFFMDLARNIDGINIFFRKLGQKTEFIYQNIIDGNINYEDLELNLSDLNFSYKQITDIIKKLVDSEQFTPNAQNRLLQNRAIYRIDTLPLIKDSFINPITFNNILTEDSDAIGTNSINIKWTPSAVCIFLSKMPNNLTNEYLDKLREKYREHPSVLIAIGHFYKYKKSEDTYIKMGNEFKYSGNISKILKFLVASIFVIFISYAIYVGPSPNNGQQTINLYLVGLAALLIIFLLVHNYVEKNDLTWSLKSHLKNYDVIKDDFVVNKIISDFESL